jgi:hypothetical protein
VWDTVKGGGFGRHLDLELQFWREAKKVLQHLLGLREQQLQQLQQLQQPAGHALLGELYASRARVSEVVEEHITHAKQAVEEEEEEEE